MIEPTAQSPYPQALFLENDQRLLAIGIEQAGVRVALLERVGLEHRLVAWIGVARAVNLIMPEQIAEACRRLSQRIGFVLWDEEEEQPFVRLIDPVRYPPIQQVVVAASPRPLLRLYLAGLSDRISMTAAIRALTGAPVQLVGSTSYAAELDAGEIARHFAEQQPEVLLIVGGYEQSSHDVARPMVNLCRTLGQALERLPRSLRPLVIYAGNQAATPVATAFLQAADGAIPLKVVENILPTPTEIQAQELIALLSKHHWWLCQRIAGFKEVADWVTEPSELRSLENNFVQLVQLWMEQNRLPFLHGLHTTSDMWLHVWAQRDQPSVQLCYTLPGNRPLILANWPPLQLVCGDWPYDLWPQPRSHWWDRSGLAALIVSVGQVAPQAMWQVLNLDLLRD